MRAEQDFESRIKPALEKECNSISASKELKCRIDEKICKRQEENSMKRMSVKKLCISVAAACLLVSGITVFAGGTAYFVTGSSTEPEYTDYRDMEKVQKQLGYEVDIIERFSNGYAFDGASVETIDACTEENGKLYSIPALDIRYRKDRKKIDLNVNEKVEEASNAKEPDATRMCGDISLKYDEYTNKYVPESYELTEEDKINEQRDDYNIVYMSIAVSEKEAGKAETDQDNADAGISDDVKRGSYVIAEDGGELSVIGQGVQEADNYVVSGTYDEVSIEHVKIVSWEKNGISYHLTGTDLDMSADEMLDMAEEILAQKNN